MGSYLTKPSTAASSNNAQQVARLPSVKLTYCQTCTFALIAFHQNTWHNNLLMQKKETWDSISSRNCHLCFLLVHDILSETQRQAIKDYSESEQRNGTSDPGFVVKLERQNEGCKVWVPNTWKSKGYSERGIRIAVFLGDPSNTAPLEPFSYLIFVPLADQHEDVFDTMNSTTTFNPRLAIHWIKQCQSQHRQCRAVLDSPGFLPTRLIDVGKDLPLRSRLCLSKNLRGRKKQYLTLSHCWGSRPLLRLLLSNLTAMLESIPYDDLPKTFQEAVQITQQLGYRYLWIDSLCIIQDDLQDWEKESQLMSAVYSNGACNLSAAGATDSSEGLFFDRDPRSVWPVRMLMDRQPAWGTNMEVAFRDMQMWEKNIADAPLNKRAWVVQERLLSRANLLFGSKQLFWECRTHKACEMLPGRSSDFNHSFGAKNVKADFSAKKLPNYKMNDLDEVIERWASIVNIYSKGALTRKTDKLVAIAGLASHLQRDTGAKYFAGLWEERSIEWQLMWRAKGPDSLPPEQYLAPSWSWASISREVAFECGTSFKPLIQVLDMKGESLESLAIARTISTGAMGNMRADSILEIGDRRYGPYGQVKSGHIVLKGYLASAVLYNTPRHSEISTSGNSTSITNGRVLKMNTNLSMIVKTIHWDGNQHGFNYANGTVFYLLPVLRDTIPGGGTPELVNWIDGLVLEKVGSSEPQRFRRCGMFSRLGMGKRSIGAFAEGFEEEDLEHQVDDNGLWRYTVTII